MQAVNKNLQMFEQEKENLRLKLERIVKCAFIMILVPSILSIVTQSALVPQNELEENFLILLNQAILSITMLILFTPVAKDNGITIQSLFVKCKVKTTEFMALSAISYSIYGVLFLLTVLVLIILYLFKPELFNILLAEDSTVSILQQVHLADYLCIILIAPIVEEIVFRGILLNVLKPYGTQFAILFTTLLFALLHGNILGFPSLFFHGYIYAKCAIYYKSIIPSIFLHGFINFANTFIKYLASINNLLIISVVFFCLIIAFILLMKKYYRRFNAIEPMTNLPHVWQICFTFTRIVLFAFMFVLINSL